MKTVTKKILNQLSENFYNIVSQETVTETVDREIPKRAGKDGIFPEYLAGFENCYTLNGATYTLNSEFEENRPTYTVEITYERFNVEFTEDGEAEIARLCTLHTKAAEWFRALMG